MKKKIRIGTRGSKLALWQADYLQSELSKIGEQSEVHIIKTKGDLVQNLSFDKLEGKGFFTKEIEDALLKGEVDLAVHSLKDMPTTQPTGLVLCGLSYREAANDCLIIKRSSLDKVHPMGLGNDAVVGTSSARRKALVADLFPNAKCADIRGNVPTRIQKLLDGEMDAIILAKAGLNRLKLALDDQLIVRDLHTREFVPAPGQGVITYQCREEDTNIRNIVRKIHHSEVLECTNIERGVLKKMDGGCQLPLGVHCEKDSNGFYHVYAGYGSPLKRVNFSQSTSVGLVDKIYEALL